MKTDWRPEFPRKRDSSWRTNKTVHGTSLKIRYPLPTTQPCVCSALISAPPSSLAQPGVDGHLRLFLSMPSWTICWLLAQIGQAMLLGVCLSTDQILTMVVHTCQTGPELFAAPVYWVLTAYRSWNQVLDVTSLHFHSSHSPLMKVLLSSTVYRRQRSWSSGGLRSWSRAPQ